MIDKENLKEYGKQNFEALLWYVKPELHDKFISCLNHGLNAFRFNVLGVDE